MITTKRHRAIVAGLEEENARMMGLFNDQTARCIKLAGIAREALAKYEESARRERAALGLRLPDKGVESPA